MDPIKNGDFSASYVSLPEGIYLSSHDGNTSDAFHGAHGPRRGEFEKEKVTTATGDLQLENRKSQRQMATLPKFNSEFPLKSYRNPKRKAKVFQASFFPGRTVKLPGCRLFGGLQHRLLYGVHHKYLVT